MTLEIRRATVADAEQLTAHVAAGFATYRTFTPPGWEPPPASAELAYARDLLADPGTWARLACADGQPVGHVSFYPARERAPGGGPGNWRARPRLPGVAHLWQLFVLEPWWGTAVAPALHAVAVAAMRAQSYRVARLYTPSAHTRARRFYERRGWETVGEAANAALGLHVAEYRLDLGPPGSRSSGTQRPPRSAVRDRS